MTTPFSVGNRIIGADDVFIIADMSANHLQQLDRAHAIIDAAADSGVDAIKLQTYTPDTITIDSDKKWFHIHGTKLWDNTTLYTLYGTAYTPWEWHAELKQHADERGLIFFSSPFDKSAVDLLEKLDVALYKIASFEAEDTHLLEYIGKQGKPVIVSRGVSGYDGIKLAIDTLTASGAPAVAVLHCNSTYPAPIEEMALAHIPQIKKDFGVVTGLSDHSRGIDAALVAVALGASIIEKHLTLARAGGGPDAAFSAEPDEMRDMIDRIRNIEQLNAQQKQKFLHTIARGQEMIGVADYTLSKRQQNNAQFKRSLFAVADIVKGEAFTTQNIRSIRPGAGLVPKFYSHILGKRAAEDIPRGTPLSWKLVEKYE